MNRRKNALAVTLVCVLLSNGCSATRAASAQEHRSPQQRRWSADSPARKTVPVLPLQAPSALCFPWVALDAWRQSPERTSLLQRDRRPNCPYSIKLAVVADDAWEVFVDGQKLVPTNGSQENNWMVPARYEIVVDGDGSSLVIGIHAKDVSGVNSGVLASLQVERLTPPSAFPPWVISTGGGSGWYAYQPSQLSPSPAADWSTAAYLPFDSATEADWAPATPASACIGGWTGNPTFLNNWTLASDGAAATGWVWEADCEAGASSWRKENWYRIDVPLDYCPSETPPPPPIGACCTWTLTGGHGTGDGLYDAPPVSGCFTDFGAVPPVAHCVDRVGCGWNPGLCKYVCFFDFWSWSCI